MANGKIIPMARNFLWERWRKRLSGRECQIESGFSKPTCTFLQDLISPDLVAANCHGCKQASFRSNQDQQSLLGVPGSGLVCALVVSGASPGGGKIRPNHVGDATALAIGALLCVAGPAFRLGTPSQSSFLSGDAPAMAAHAIPPGMAAAVCGDCPGGDGSDRSQCLPEPLRATRCESAS